MRSKAERAIGESLEAAGCRDPFDAGRDARGGPVKARAKPAAAEPKRAQTAKVGDVIDQNAREAYPVSRAHALADIVADKLELLAANLYAASLPEGDGFHGMSGVAVARTIADDRNEAAGALERLMFAMPEDTSARAAAQLQAGHVRACGMPAYYRHWAAAWRAFSSGAS